MSTSISIGDRAIGPGEPTFVIAEAGINHNGSLKVAKMMIDVAANAGVDCIKFQKRDLDSLYRKDVLSDPNREGQSFQFLIPLLREVELSEEEYVEIAAHCRNRGVLFLCTPWDKPSVDFLETLNVPAYKVASADMTNLDLLEYIAARGKPMIVSTGMSTWEEICKTVDFLKGLRAEFMLMHCNSTYPSAYRDVNLRLMERLAGFGVPIGYSGHERGIVVSTVASALGACVIERHFTLDRTMRGPDHAASIEPEGLTRMVKYMRTVELAMGTDQRRISRGEEMLRESLGKSLVAACDIPEGTLIEREMIVVKSPGRGVSPQMMDSLVGKPAPRDIPAESEFVPSDMGVAQ